MKPIFLGWQFSRTLPPIALFNADIGYGETTLSAKTLTKNNIPIPPHPSADEWADTVFPDPRNTKRIAA